MADASSTDFLTRYTEGFAQILAAAGFAWQPTGKYTADQTGIFIAAVPTDPTRIVTLTPTPMDSAPVYTDSRVDLQIRFRSGPNIRDAWIMRDQARAALHGIFPRMLPTGVYVSAVEFAYGGSLGQDDARRWAWADNWRTRVAEPT